MTAPCGCWRRRLVKIYPSKTEPNSGFRTRIGARKGKNSNSLARAEDPGQFALTALGGGISASRRGQGWQAGVCPLHP